MHHKNFLIIACRVSGTLLQHASHAIWLRLDSRSFIVFFTESLVLSLFASIAALCVLATLVVFLLSKDPRLRELFLFNQHLLMLQAMLHD